MTETPEKPKTLAVQEKTARITIDAESAQRWRSKLVGMNRASANIEANARAFKEFSSELITLLDLITTETERP